MPEGEEPAKSEKSEELGEWKKLWQCSVKDVVVRMIQTLADEEGRKVETGFHLVVIPAENEMLMQIPTAGNRLKIILTDSPLEALIEVAPTHDVQKWVAKSTLYGCSLHVVEPCCCAPRSESRGLDLAVLTMRNHVPRQNHGSAERTWFLRFIGAFIEICIHRT